MTEQELSTLIGLSEREATRRIEKKSLTIHIMRRDDRIFARTMDIRQDRVNMEITDGKVVLAEIG